MHFLILSMNVSFCEEHFYFHFTPIFNVRMNNNGVTQLGLHRCYSFYAAGAPQICMVRIRLRVRFHPDVHPDMPGSAWPEPVHWLSPHLIWIE